MSHITLRQLARSLALIAATLLTGFSSAQAAEAVIKVAPAFTPKQLSDLPTTGSATWAGVRCIAAPSTAAIITPVAV